MLAFINPFQRRLVSHLNSTAPGVCKATWQVRSA